jgi:hypothetical protein
MGIEIFLQPLNLFIALMSLLGYQILISNQWPGIIVLVLILVVWRIKTPAKAWVDRYNGTISTEEER